MLDRTPSIEEFGRQLRDRKISALEMTDECLRRIEADNPRLNAFILVMTDEARAQARDADAELAAGRDRGALHGVPISIKDIFDIHGTATTAASRVRDGHIAARDAAAVTHLRHAGAVLIGKTNLHEFAFGTTNEDSAFGPARNPFDPSRSPGGSSGGSAVSVATGMALASLGTDTGGSIRIPAAACGIIGLKPTLGELPTDGVVPLSTTMDHVGPLTRTVRDAWHMFEALQGHGAGRPLTPLPLAGLRLAVVRQYFCDLLDDDVRSAFDRAVEALTRAGARVDEALIPHASVTGPVYMHISFGDAAAYHARLLDTVPERYTKPVRLRLEMARYVLGEDYVRALNGRTVLTREVDAALAGYDAILLPTLPIPAPTIGAATVQIGSEKVPVRLLTLRLTQLFNVTGHPALTLPCGSTSDLLPVGLQLVGARHHTELLLRVALAVESVLDRA